MKSIKMKKRIIVVAACLAACYIANAAVEFIRWQWMAEPVLRIERGGQWLEFGLRQDGVVVWREISSNTNSPAENTVFVGYMNLIITHPIYQTNLGILK